MSHPALTKTGVATAVLSLALSSAVLTPAKAVTQDVEREIVNNVIQNILQNVRDQIQRRRIEAPPGRFQFTGEDSNFDARNPFAANDPGNPFAALAYAKAPAMAPAPVPTWLFGINGIASGDRTSAVNAEISLVTATGAVDVTKIGVFTATDALTFVATGSGTWSHILGSLGALTMNTSTGTGSGTLAYVNGGFSADFTGTASWTHVDWVALGFVAPPDSSALSYTGNVQYKYNLPYTFWIEPTIGFTYTEAYTANFGTKLGDATEVHVGGRVGFETKWMGFTIMPSMGGQVYKIVEVNGAGIAGTGVFFNGDTGLGARGSAKINVLWTPNFSSFIEAHGSGIAGTKGNSIIPGNFVATQTYGGMGGLRYSW